MCEGGWEWIEKFRVVLFSLPPCGVCRSPVPLVYSINYKRKKAIKPYGVFSAETYFLAKRLVTIVNTKSAKSRTSFGGGEAGRHGRESRA